MSARPLLVAHEVAVVTLCTSPASGPGTGTVGMSTPSSLADQASLSHAQAFLSPLLPGPPGPSSPSQQNTRVRPHVTLTYAQSLDGKIAAAHGRPLKLSGRESWMMTHLLRSKHDAILVGVGTVLADDPQLNVRLLPLPPPTPAAAATTTSTSPDAADPSTSHSTSPAASSITPALAPAPTWPTPLPLILDTHLRLPPSSLLLRNHTSGTGRQPWVFCAALELPHPAHPELRSRKARLSEQGAEVFELPLLGAFALPPPSLGLRADVACMRMAETGLSLPSLLAHLHSRGIRSLMVEGGQRVIFSFLSQGLFDLLIVTVAPTLVGPEGVGFARRGVLGGGAAGAVGDIGKGLGEGLGVPRLRSIATEVFGRDAVMAMVPEPEGA
ncbi:hypothetical protein CALVIDRAFT_113718 [Calocera viscosa TUFC12733]|uniref:2,5-diamino-6-ribosylamino-4(3H)-pyrimidinone 5'-phosphate reductase n=1 Tax=Calocera viscosa (strain TUFC12733) TaxID=1330018 RepID=A0A167M5D0_CALVF|nr:hypothetical protein CALVIDRAFT_113718 [Calocera viscosa TUFC12733]